MTESLHDEVIRVAQDLIRLDTTNAREPGLGNETRCAEYLRDYLTAYGVEAELVAREPHRANLVARIPAGGFETVAERPPQPPDRAEPPPQPPDRAERPPQPPDRAERPPQPPDRAERPPQPPDGVVSTGSTDG